MHMQAYSTCEIDLGMKKLFRFAFQCTEPGYNKDGLSLCSPCNEQNTLSARQIQRMLVWHYCISI